MNKIQFGCGSNLLPGWLNLDVASDIRKSLKFEDESAAFVFCEHVIEHVTFQQAWNFFDECHRILCPGGVLRVAFPDIVRISDNLTPEYCAAVKNDGFGEGTEQDAIKAVIFSHGHQSVWCESLMISVLDAIGFYAIPQLAGISKHPELMNVEQHGKVVGEAIARVETSVVEATKYE